MFGLGVVMAFAAVYIFFDSIRVSTGHAESSQACWGSGQGRLIETTSMGINFIPFFRRRFFSIR